MSTVERRFHFRNRAVTRARPRALREIHARGGGLLSASVSAENVQRPESLIKWRQSAYQVIAWNSGASRRRSPACTRARKCRARRTAAVANSGLATLFIPGTASGKGWREPRRAMKFSATPKNSAH
jgi:hypothetical protein